MKNGVIMQDDVYHNESLKMLCSNNNNNNNDRLTAFDPGQPG